MPDNPADRCHMSLCKYEMIGIQSTEYGGRAGESFMKESDIVTVLHRNHVVSTCIP